MECPQCKRTFLKDESVCPWCRYDLSRAVLIQGLKEDAQHIRSEVASLQEGITVCMGHVYTLQDHLKRLETALAPPLPQPERMPEARVPEIAGYPETVIKPEAEKPEPIVQPEISPVFNAPRPRQHAAFQYQQLTEIHVGQKWLLIAGIVFTVLAVGWFLKYSFDRNWIDPAGRVSMAYLAGLAFLGAGEWFRRKELPLFGLSLVGGGIATLYFATFAAFTIYHLFSQTMSFFIMILVTMLAGTLSLVYDTIWLAVLGLIGGFITPVALSTGQDNQVALMTYMTILNTGILGIAFFKQWRQLNYLGFIFTWFLFAQWYGKYYADPKFWITLTFLNIFFLTYALAPFAYHILKDQEKRLSGIGLLVPNAFIALGYSIVMIRDYARLEYAGIVTVIYAAIHLWMAQHIYRRDQKQVEAYVMLIAQALVFLVITIPILFSDHWITIFWAIQAVAILWAALKLENRWLYGSFVLLLAITLYKFFFYDLVTVFPFMMDEAYFINGYATGLVARVISEIIVVLALFQSARMVRDLPREFQLFHDYDGAVLWCALSVAIFIMLNMEVSAGFYDYYIEARFAAISVLWAIFSIVLMVLGFINNNLLLRQCAIALFGVTMFKVFFADMANVSTPWRIVSFMILGLMLIGASYLYYRFKDLILPEEQKEEPKP